jgi:hypothetical protein
MKYEIIVNSYNYYRKQYLDCPSPAIFEYQFFFWKQLKKVLTNENKYISNSELCRLITLEAGRI